MEFQKLDNTCSMIHMNSVSVEDLYRYNRQQLLDVIRLRMPTGRSFRDTKAIIFNSNFTKFDNKNRLRKWGFKLIDIYKGNSGHVYVYLMNPHKLTWREKLIKFLN